MHWVDAEVPEDCFHRVLTSCPGAAALRSSGTLPVERDKDRTMKAVQDNKIVAVQAQPGSGKTTRIPDYSLQVQTQDRRAGLAILVVEPACYAAQKIANCFVFVCG